jgi:enoyl-[acyl-carrier protein] reductase III
VATTLVVGGTKGIGLAVARRFAGPGEMVLVNGHHDREAGERAAAQVRELGADAVLLWGDVGDPATARELVRSAGEHVDRIDRVVHCSVRTLSRRLAEVDPEEFAASVRVGALSLLHVVQAALPMLPAGASVVYLSSLGGQRVVPGYAAVGVAKAAGEALVRYLAHELAPRGIRVNTVSSGPLDTDAYRSMFVDADSRLAAAAERSPAHRPQTVDDVAELVALMCSPAAELVQGQHVRVDGGLYL